MNRLGAESSPYLQQHADNPVHWYPWGPDALAEATRTDTPILLSVGYSACHWCHVMAHESFEDPETAALMNQWFVNIKVDREERPDVDAIYMEAVQSLTGHGGWPLTVFLTPDGAPFLGGTYYPKEGRPGMPSFTDVLRTVHDFWTERRADVVHQAQELTHAIEHRAALAGSHDLGTTAILDRAIAGLRQQYDAAWGGFGRAPKFPHTMSLDALFAAYTRTGDHDLLHMATNSLDAMASGGIYDHLAGGFARYSVDAQWIVPHFEKMLYDNAQLARVYLHAWQLTRKPRFLQVVEETLGYLLRELRHPDGGFYSSEDADSEGQEGKYYLWTPEQIRSVLGDDGQELMSWYGVTDQGNFEGRNILWRPVRGDLLRTVGLDSNRQRLLAAREMRIRPGLDNKVLTEWNGLALATLAEASAATGNHRWADAAKRNARFLLAHLRRADGRWMRSWQADDREARHLGYAADYASVVNAFTRLTEATGASEWIGHARDAADELLRLFWDDENGGVFTTGTDADALITRPKDFTDNAVPSANSATAIALARLGALTGEMHYTQRAEACMRLVGDLAGTHPTAFGAMLEALAFTSAPIEVVIPGEPRNLVDAVRSRYLPTSVLAWGERYDSPLWEAREQGKAYVCRNYTCESPTEEQETLEKSLGLV